MPVENIHTQHEKTLTLNTSAAPQHTNNQKKLPKKKHHPIKSREYKAPQVQTKKGVETFVHTWVWMWQSGQTPEIRKRGEGNLIRVFGSVANVIKYIEANDG
jgi:hypothetical protein